MQSLTVYTAEEAQTELNNVQLDAVIAMNGTAPQVTLGRE